MDEVRLELTDEEFSRVSPKSCADAALEICRIHFRRADPNVDFITAGKGADLRVRSQDGVETDLEVKGTEKLGMAWSQFKVSSQQSHDLLVKGLALYRVTGIGSHTVTLFIMKHGVDFEMLPEPRWSVHPPRRH